MPVALCLADRASLVGLNLTRMQAALTVASSTSLTRLTKLFMPVNGVSQMAITAMPPT